MLTIFEISKSQKSEHASCRDASCRDASCPNVSITEARVGGRVGNPRGLTAPGAGPGSARGRDSPRRPLARGRHSLPGVGPTHFSTNNPLLTLAPTVRVFNTVSFKSYSPFYPYRRAAIMFPDLDPVGGLSPIWNMMLAVSQGRMVRHMDCPLPPARRARGRRVDAPGWGLTRPLAGPGSARGRDSFGLPVAPVRHSL